MPSVELTGLDGAGKTTIAKVIATRFGHEYRRVDAFHDHFERRMRGIESRLGPSAVLAARAAAITIALLEEGTRRKGINLISDRYIESARMFWHVAGSGSPPTDVLGSLPQNDAVVLLDIPVDLAIQRAKASRFTDRTIERIYLDECADYLRTQAVSNGWIVVDARLPLEATTTEVARLLGLTEVAQSG